MSNITLLIQEVLLKYKSLDANIIHERNKLINDENLHNELCNMLANHWQTQCLTQPIVCATLGGSNKICSMIDKKQELMGKSPYWELSKAQLKVNQQRDNIDLLLCELLKITLENKEQVEEKKTHIEYQTLKSFLGATLGALLVNILYNYSKF